MGNGRKDCIWTTKNTQDTKKLKCNTLDSFATPSPADLRRVIRAFRSKKLSSWDVMAATESCDGSGCGNGAFLWLYLSVCISSILL